MNTTRSHSLWTGSVCRAPWIVAVAGLVGALLGSVFGRSYVAACECASPMWQLQIDTTTAMDDTVWPARAVLKAFENDGPILVDSINHRESKVDHLMGGSW